MAVSQIVLEAVELSKIYTRGTVRVEALRSVSLTVNRGEFVALSGPSGCGKSTLLNILGLALPPSSGHLRIEGIEVDFDREKALVQIRRKKLGYVFQYFNLLPTLTARENVALSLVLNGVTGAEASKRAGTMLDRVGLSHRSDQLPAELSGGEMQRVAIARACVHHPAVILADEPTGNLDTQRGDEILDLLAERCAEGAAVIVATHSPRARERATTILELRDGAVAT